MWAGSCGDVQAEQRSWTDQDRQSWTDRAEVASSGSSMSDRGTNPYLAGPYEKPKYGRPWYTSVLSLGRALSDGLLRVAGSPRRWVALSVCANITLAMLLMFKAAPQAQPYTAEHWYDMPPLQREAITLGAERSSGAAFTGGKAWLTIGIPTIPRKKGTDYLTSTIESLLDELPGDPTDLLYGRVRVVLMNNAPPGKHPAFAALRRRIMHPPLGDERARKGQVYLEFVESPATERDPTPNAEEPDDLNNPGDVPGSAVRKQTADLIMLLEHAQPLGTYYLFMEDDFRVCPYMLRALQYVVCKANAKPALKRWLGIRVSYGMNGVLLRSADLPSFVAVLRAGVTRKPPDLLWQAWATGEDRPADVQQRPLAVYKYNLLAHKGTMSSFKVRPERARWPGCFAPMSGVWSLHVLERFSERDCGARQDMSPCSLASDETVEPWTSMPIHWPTEEAGASMQRHEGSREGVLRRKGVGSDRFKSSSHTGARSSSKRGAQLG